MSTIFKIV